MSGFGQKLLYWVMALTMLGVSLALTLTIESRFQDRGHYTGDDTSSLAVWNGGRNFSELGFWNLRGVPIQDIVPGLPRDQTPPARYFYTHYPAGPDLMQGLEFKLGFESERSHRNLAILTSALGLLITLLFLLRLFEPVPALIGWCSLLLAPSTLFFSDSLHGESWFFIFKAYYLLRLVIYIQSPASRSQIGWWVEFFALGLVASWFSFDAIPATLAFGIVLFWTDSAPLAFAAILGELIGFLLHVAKNGMVLGGFAPALQDMIGALLDRTGQTDLGEARLNYNFVKHVAKFTIASNWFFGLPTLALAAWGWITQIQRRVSNLWVGLLVATLTSAVAWQVLFKQHGMIHAFTSRHWETWSTLGVACLAQLALGKNQLTSSLRRAGVARRARVAQIGLFAGLSLLISHSVLVIRQVSLLDQKASAIKALLTQQVLANWACRQLPYVSNSKDLRSEAAWITSVAALDCNPTEISTFDSVKADLASLILYWR